MKYLSQVYTAASGSIGGVVYSHNKGGGYTRGRSVPSNPNTIYQQTVRNVLAQLAAAWLNSVSVAQRAAWEVFATNVPVVNALGQQFNLSGQQWYLKANTGRVAAGKTRIDAAPTDFALASLSAVTVGAGAPDTASVGFVNTDAWAGAVGGHLLVYASRPQSPTINYFKGPYRLMGIINGAVVLPTSPQAMTLPFPVASEGKIFFRAIATQADGRPSADFRFQSIAT